MRETRMAQGSLQIADEEFFTALLRQDKRAVLLRYQGEWHTISNRANVLDLWKRVTDWLAATMAPRK